MQSINLTVASQLKKFRHQKGWSLDIASQHCGVSKAMLGQIERGESSPTIAKLWQIATGFSLPLSDFLSPKTELESSLSEQEVTIKTLFEFDPVTAIEVFELHMAIGHEHQSQAHQVGVVEHIIVISGEMQYFQQAHWLTLNSGERAKFNADQPHAYRNTGDEALRFINIIYYPRAVKVYE